MSRVLSLAGFQVTLIGRFWVTTEGRIREHAAASLQTFGWPLAMTRQDVTMSSCRVDRVRSIRSASFENGDGTGSHFTGNAEPEKFPAPKSTVSASGYERRYMPY